MRKNTRNVLEMLIHELQSILSDTTESVDSKVTKVGESLDSWVRGNDLHPENVETLILSPEEAEKRFGVRVE